MLFYSVITFAETIATIADIEENMFNYSEHTRVIFSDKRMFNSSLLYS